MKLQVDFNIQDLDKALDIADQIKDYIDILEIGPLLIYKYGVDIIKKFKQKFPQKILNANVNLINYNKDLLNLIIQSETDWLTVLAGTPKNSLHNICLSAHESSKKVMLNLIDASSLGQSALEAKSLGVDSILFYEPHDKDNLAYLANNWEIVKGNTTLPIYISGTVTKENIESITSYKPAGIIIGQSITKAEDPVQAAQYYYKIINS